MTAPTLTCPTWCVRTHVEGPGFPIVHEGALTAVEVVPEPNGVGRPPVTVALLQVDDEPAYVCLNGDLLTAEAAEDLGRVLLAQAAAELQAVTR